MSRHKQRKLWDKIEKRQRVGEQAQQKVLHLETFVSILPPAHTRATIYSIFVSIAYYMPPGAFHNYLLYSLFYCFWVFGIADDSSASFPFVHIFFCVLFLTNPAIVLFKRGHSSPRLRIAVKTGSTYPLAISPMDMRVASTVSALTAGE